MFFTANDVKAIMAVASLMDEARTKEDKDGLLTLQFMIFDAIKDRSSTQ